MSRDGGNPELKLAITPMIDVVFLLLIFFMLLPFRSLERKLQAHLPKEKGIIRWNIKIPPRPKITVELLRKSGETETRIRLLDTLLGSGAEAFRTLDARIAAIHARNDELPGFLDAGNDVPHGDVIRCIDSFRNAGIEELEFKGTEPPGRDS